MVEATTMVNLSLKRYLTMRPKLCFADLVKINNEYKLNLDNITLLFIYDRLDGDIIKNAKRVKSKLQLIAKHKKCIS